MSVYTSITLAMAKRFEGREVVLVVLNLHIQQNKLQVGIKETKTGGVVLGGGQFDEHHLSGPVRLCWTPMIN